jgi:ribosomal protein S18 acetylase RimI-like enzyme
LIHVRPAGTADLATVAEIHIEARAAYWAGVLSPGELAQRAHYLRQDGYTPEKLARPGFTLTVAEEDDTLLGFVLTGPPHDETADPQRVGELWQIHVRPDHWRRGIGGRLHDACVTAWRAASIAEAHLEVWERNARGRAFYEARGWVLDRVVRPAIDGTNFVRLRLALG